MPDFTVDIGGLEALGKNLDRTTENIEQALQRMKDVGPDSIGPDDLDSACADFQSGWEGGLTKIKDAVQHVRDGLNGAVKGYAELEHGIATSLAKMGNETNASEGQ